MNIEIHRPEIEALIQQRLEMGGFQDMQQAQLHALRTAPLPTKDGEAEPPCDQSLEQVFAMVRGLADDLDVSRDRSTGRAVDSGENLAQLLLDSPLPG